MDVWCGERDGGAKRGRQGAATDALRTLSTIYGICGVLLVLSAIFYTIDSYFS